MHTLPALRAGALALACVLAPVAHANGTIELLTGIPRLACEATPGSRVRVKCVRCGEMFERTVPGSVR